MEDCHPAMLNIWDMLSMMDFSTVSLSGGHTWRNSLMWTSAVKHWCITITLQPGVYDFLTTCTWTYIFLHMWRANSTCQDLEYLKVKGGRCQNCPDICRLCRMFLWECSLCEHWRAKQVMSHKYGSVLYKYGEKDWKKWQSRNQIELWR